MLEHLMYRTVQKGLYLISFLIPWKFPRVIKTYDSPSELVSLLRKYQVKSILLVSDQSLVKLQLIEPFITLCEQHHIAVVLYDKVVPNPTLDNVEEGYALALKHNVEWLVAIGGGSVMDAAKAIGVKMVRKTPLKKLKGILKVIKPIPPLVCIPTTAGTGSETTVASVLS
ncbi:MAG: iron-containing alcohol dehydrogenase, partial [Erysipelothrix sp.]|nr:iron-containing alcohol dehydrogenase [Erysipelothrix sp.]